MIKISQEVVRNLFNTWVSYETELNGDIWLSLYLAACNINNDIDWIEIQMDIFK